MTTYEIQDAKGRTLEIEGDHEPSEAELSGIFAQTFPEQKSDPLRTPYKANMADVGISGGEFENAAPVVLPPFGEPGTPTRGVSKALTGLVESATSTEGVALAPAMMIPVVGPVLAVAMGAGAVKQAAQLAGEASVTKNPETMAEAGVLGLLGAGSVVMGGAHLATKPTTTPLTDSEISKTLVEENKPAKGTPELAPVSQAPAAGKVSETHQASEVAASESPPVIIEPNTSSESGQAGVAPTAATEPAVGESTLPGTAASEPTTPPAQVEAGGASPLSAPVTEPSPPESRPLGIAAPSTFSFLERLKDAYWKPVKDAFSEFNLSGFMQRSLPKFTKANREVGESGARYAAAPAVGRQLGEAFADDVMDGLNVDNRKFGVAIKEDNLRSIKAGFQSKATELRAQASANPNADTALLEDAALYDNAANSVVTFVGAENSPFATEAEFQSFLRDPEVVEAVSRHKQLWGEQKEPLYREAANIDPEVELASRGEQTQARINLTFAKEGERGVTPRGGTGDVRQLGTLLRRDPFARQATGTGNSYEAGYRETMGSAFEQEYPVAAQHEFVRKILETGIGEVGDNPKAPHSDWKSYPLRLKPWTGRYLYLPRRLSGEYEPIVGLAPGAKIPVFTALSHGLTRQAIVGLGEGTAHSANILLKLFTGITTDRPLFEAFMSAIPGRPDVWYSTTRALIRGLRPDGKAMLALAKINAAKHPYSGIISSHFLNPLDRGVRLLSKDVYQGLAERGVVPDTETGLREFVNEIGNYTSSTQSWLVRNLRSSGVQPFATGFRTAKVQAVKRLFLGSGLEATNLKNNLALKTAIASKFVGTAATVATLNYLLNGSARGLPGTRLGAISWTGDDGKTHEFDLAGLFGATAGARAIGLVSPVEMKERGLDVSTSLKAGAKSVATTATSQVAGPAVRFATVALTGKDPYGYQIAPVAPPSESVFRSQIVKNITAALQGVNPLVDVAMSAHEGKTWDEIRQRQLTRYATRTPSGVQTSDNYAQTVTKANLNEYADWLSSRARKLSMPDRHEFVLDRLDKDQVEGQDRLQVIIELKRKGTFKYD